MYKAGPSLAAAARDYRWLLDRSYPGSASLKLVGDRFALTGEERLVLFRGVAGSAESGRRIRLVDASTRGRRLLVDGYNQILTVYHYTNGRPVFVAADGVLRDAGGAHGRIADRERFARAMDILATALAAAGPSSILAFFDAPVSGSALHARAFADSLRLKGIEAEASVERSADPPLKLAGSGDMVASSDSAILDALAARGGARVFDAARAAIEGAFGPRSWLDLGSVLGSAGPGPDPSGPEAAEVGEA
jgi:hypothetical protein